MVLCLIKKPLCNDPQDRLEALGYLGAEPKPNLLSGLQTKLGRSVISILKAQAISSVTAHHRWNMKFSFAQGQVNRSSKKRRVSMQWRGLNWQDDIKLARVAEEYQWQRRAINDIYINIISIKLAR